MRRALLALLLFGADIGAAARAQVFYNGVPPSTIGWGATVCSNTSIPAAVSATTETAFGAACVIRAGTLVSGSAIHLHLAGLYTAGTAQNARGRVHVTQSGTQAPATDPTIADTNSVGGLAAASNEAWSGDVFIVFLAPLTSLDAQGALVFQTGAQATVTVPVSNTSTFSYDPTKDLTIYVTVAWGAAGNSMQLRTMVAK